MLRSCRLQKKIDQERDVACPTQAPMSLDGGEFQKAQIRISPNNQIVGAEYGPDTNQ
jgi:hypothetical protein